MNLKSSRRRYSEQKAATSKVRQENQSAPLGIGEGVRVFISKANHDFRHALATGVGGVKVVHKA